MSTGTPNRSQPGNRREHGAEDRPLPNGKPDVSPRACQSRSEWAISVKDALTKRLHKLEVANKQLSDEKTQLEHQLMHILERLATSTYSGKACTRGESSSAPAREEERIILPELINKLRSYHLGEIKHPPLVTFGPSGSDNSLRDSGSFKLYTDYSSLSDAYEDICLNKDPAARLFTSESEPISDVDEEMLPHDLSQASNQTSHIPTVTGHSNKVARRVKSERMDQQYEYKSCKHNYPVPNRSSSTSDMSYLSFLNVSTTKMPSNIRNPLWQSSSENTSISSSRSHSPTSSSSRSFHISREPSCTRGSPSSSGPPSPIWFMTAQDALTQNQQPSARIMQKKKQRFQYSPVTTDRVFHAETYGTPKLLRKRGDSVHQPSGGPPRINITRRRIKSPVAIEESTDTTASTASLIQPRTFRKKESTLHYPDSKVPLSYLGNTISKSIKIQPNKCRVNEKLKADVKVHDRYVPFVDQYKRQHDQKQCPKIDVGHMHNFLNSKISFYRPLPMTPDSLYEVGDDILIQLLSNMIAGLEVYTCIKKRVTLLLCVQPSKTCVMPILNQSTLNHSQQSSEATSDWSPPTTDEQSATKSSTHDNLALTWIKTFGGSSRPVRRGSSENIQPSTTHSVTIMEQKTVPCDECLGDDNFVLHKSTIFRLSNHVKIWRRYYGFLSLTSLLLYTDEWPSKRQASCCILLSDIRFIRRPSNLSTSVTAGLTVSRVIHQDQQSNEGKYIASSVPTTRKFQPVHSLISGRNSSDYFEIILNSGKTYRYRGETYLDTNQWMLLIRRAFRAVRARDILQRNGAQLTTQGYLKRIKGGIASRVWCRLVGEYLIYSKSSESTMPSGYRSLRDTHVRYKRFSPSVDRRGYEGCIDTQEWTNDCVVSNSDSDSLTLGDMDTQQRTIALWLLGSDPVYLLIDSEQECQQWYHHLVNARKREDVHSEVSFDSARARSSLQSHWKTLVRPEHINSLFHSSLLTRSPLSLSIDLKSSAETSMKICACLLFLSYPEVEYIQPNESAAVNIQLPLVTLLGASQWQTMKYAVIKWLANCCLADPVLKDELYLQLIKQATLTEGQMARWMKTEVIQRTERTNSPRRGFSILCSKPGPSDPVKRLQASSFETQHPPLSEVNPLCISSNQKALISDIVDQLTPNANVILPAPTVSSLNRLHGGWPVLAIWECLCLCLPLFLPSVPVLHCLQLLLRVQLSLDNSNKLTAKSPVWIKELSLYAAFCHQAIANTKMLGGRTQKPSALEVTAISMRNPYTYTFPFSLPIHWLEGNGYEVLSFNGSSNFQYIVEQFVKKLGFKSDTKYQNVILGAIYLRVSKGNSQAKYHYYLKPDWKICDVISLYEESILQQNRNAGKTVHLEETRVEFVFRIQAFSWHNLKTLDHVQTKKKVLNLICHQLHADIVSGAYQVDFNGNDLLNLASLMCRADHINYTELQRRRQFTMDQLLHLYFPHDWLSTLVTDNQAVIKLKLLLLDRWMLIAKTHEDPDKPAVINTARVNEVTSTDNSTQKSAVDEFQFAETLPASMAYLRYLRQLSPNRFGMSSFVGYVDGISDCALDQLVWLVPQVDQLSFLVMKRIKNTTVPSSSRQSTHISRAGFECIFSIPYRNVLSFGGQSNGSLFLVHAIQPAVFGDRVFATGAREPHRSSIRGRSELERRIYDHRRFPFGGRSSAKQDLQLAKLHIYLRDLNAVMELTDTLVYLINTN